jgi:SAM-dependent methyltransferase
VTVSRHADRYPLKDSSGSSHAILASWMRALPAATRVLELGAGTAQVARVSQRGDLDWVGLEQDPRCLPVLRRFLKGAAIVDLEGLCRLPRGYHVMLAADVLEHLGDPQSMLAKIRDALPSGGRLFVSVPNVAHLYVRMNLLCGRFPYGERGILDRTHRYFFTRRSLRRELRQAGFDIEREAVSVVPLRLVWPHWPPALVAALEGLLRALTRAAPTLLGYQLLVAARIR